MITLLQNALKVMPERSIQVAQSPATCGGYGGVTIPNRYKDGSEKSHDVIVFLTAWPPLSEVNLAWALGCRLNSIFRPVMGQINIAPPTDLDDEDVFTTMLHEMIHMLGFSADNFEYLYNAAKGTRRPTSEVYKSATVFGKSTHKMILPEPVAAAREYFGCASLDGVELEESDFPGDVGSHWEARILKEEMMSPVRRIDRSLACRKLVVVHV